MKTLKYNKLLILLLFLMVSVNALLAQSKTGTIKDGNNSPLMGYVVKNITTGIQSISDSDGSFEISAKTGDVLNILLDELIVNKIVVDEGALNIVIYSNPFNTDVDAAYGKINRRKTSAAIDVVTAEKIGETSFTNTHHAVIGQLAGLTTVQSKGEPGSNDLDFFIRGKSTFRDNAPLVLVDGFESDFAHLNSHEIESVTILKDAVATAMYGMRAANGVILVTTKRGKIGKSKFNVNADYGLLSPVTMPEFVNAYDYATMVNEAHANDGIPARYSNEQLKGYKTGGDPYNYPNIDWQDEMLKKSTSYANASIEFRGGSNKVKYYSLLSYMYADGLFKHTEENDQYSTANRFSRINFRTNADIELNKRLDLQLGIGGRIENRNDPEAGTDNLINNIYNSPANRYVMYNEDGSYGGSNQYRKNPMGEIASRGYNEKHTRFVNFNLRLNHQMDYILDGLTGSIETSFLNTFDAKEQFVAKYIVYDRELVTLPDGSTQVNYLPYGTEQTITNKEKENKPDRPANQDRTQTFRTYLNYAKVVGEHSYDCTVLYENRELIYRNDAEPYRYQGFSGRFNYGYKDKYFVDLVASYNGSNAYNPDQQFGFFPAAGFAWEASKEDFMKSISWVDYLKVRTSYGIVGNSLLDGYRRFAYLSTYGEDGKKIKFGDTGVSSTDGLSEKDIANPDAEWEKGSQFNIGFDLISLKKVNVSFDYFNEKRTDILQSRDNDVTAMTGITLPQVNYGEVKNSGVEITLGYSNKMANGLSWYVESNLGFAKNEITKRYEVAKDPQSKIGNSIDAIYGFVADGFYSDPQDITSSPENTLYSVQPGDVKYKNIKGDDNIIDKQDVEVIGNSFPELNYGINIGADYKGVYFKALLDGNAKRDIMMNNHLMFRPLNDGYNNISKYAANNYWTDGRTSNAKLPRLTAGDNYNNYVESTLYLQNGNFMRLRTAELGYKFPVSLISKLGMSSAKLYVRGHNMLVIDNMDADLDPEVRSGHPLLKSYNIGVNIQF